VDIDRERVYVIFTVNVAVGGLMVSCRRLNGKKFKPAVLEGPVILEILILDIVIIAD